MAIMMNASPMMEITTGMVSSPMIILNPVAIINMNPKTAKGSERRETMVFVITNSLLSILLRRDVMVSNESY
jgi:hypothetical protein